MFGQKSPNPNVQYCMIRKEILEASLGILVANTWGKSEQTLH